jgi:hypothetical protein
MVVLLEMLRLVKHNFWLCVVLGIKSCQIQFLAAFGTDEYWQTSTHENSLIEKKAMKHIDKIISQLSQDFLWKS